MKRNLLIDSFYKNRKFKNIINLDAISQLQDNWNGYGAKKFSAALVMVCRQIVEKISFQPNDISPTGRDSIQFEYELTDKSYLEFEFYLDKVGILFVPKNNYDDSISRTMEFAPTIIIEMDMMIKLFIQRKFDDLKTLIGRIQND